MISILLIYDMQTCNNKNTVVYAVANIQKF